jgi:hypothetical protein
MAESQAFSLPTEAVPAKRKSPKNLVLYGQPKIGKTTAVATLPNCLIIDLEMGTDMISALKVQVNNLKELSALGKAIKDAGKPYKYIAVDTVTELESWCEAEAKVLYKATPIGKNFDPENKGISVLTLPKGGGYLYLRIAIQKWMSAIEQLADHIIWIGHLRDSNIEKAGKEVAAKDLDLTGKVRNIVCKDADAVGYIFREEGTTMISFNSNENVNAGSRCEHLRGQVMELDWSKIFID